MSIYLVALNQPDEGAWTRLKAEWPKRHYTLTDRLAFIAPEEPILTEEICQSIGMSTEADVTGFVAKIDYGALNGWNRQALWEWLSKHQ